MMHGTFKCELRFCVREVSREPARGLMACLVEVRGCAARFERRGGRLTEHRYVYRDTDALARADVDAGAGALRPCDIGVHGDEMAVHVGARLRIDALQLPIAQPKWLTADVSGSNKRDVVETAPRDRRRPRVSRARRL